MKRIRELPIQVRAIVVDKSRLNTDGWAKYEGPFRKRYARMLLSELMGPYGSRLYVTADRVGSERFMRDFTEYVDRRCGGNDLFRSFDYHFESSCNSVGIQIADFVGGTLAGAIDPANDEYHLADLLPLVADYLRFSITPRETSDAAAWSDTEDRYSEALCSGAEKSASQYVSENTGCTDSIVMTRVACAEVLLMKLIEDPHQFIHSDALMQEVSAITGHEMNTRVFQTEVVAQLKDSKVRIASCELGYKLVASLDDLNRTAEMTDNLVTPAIRRFSDLREFSLSATDGNCDPLSLPCFKHLRAFDEALQISKSQLDRGDCASVQAASHHRESETMPRIEQAAV